MVFARKLTVNAAAFAAVILFAGCSSDEEKLPGPPVVAEVTSRVGDLEVDFGGNGPDRMAGIQARYKGRELFILGGLNPEHLSVPYPDDRNHFTPRSGELTASLAPGTSATLSRPASASPWGASFTMTFAVRKRSVDFAVELTLPTGFPSSDAVFFIASYPQPATRDVAFRASSGWVRMTQTEGRKDSHAIRSGSLALPLVDGDDLLTTNLNSDHPWRFTEPTYYGELDNGLALQIMLAPEDGDDVRLTVMRSYPLGVAPAYDFGWILRYRKPGSTHRLRGRLSVLEGDDLEALAQREYDTWLATLR